MNLLSELMAKTAFSGPKSMGEGIESKVCDDLVYGKHERSTFWEC